MPDPVSTFVLGALDTLSKLWDKSLTLFFAFAVICLLLLGLSMAAVIFGVGDATVIAPIILWLIAGAVVFGVLTLAKIIERRINRSFYLIPDEQQSFWHRAPQPDGKNYTQISLHFQVTNLTRAPLLLSAVSLKRPWIFGSRITKHIATLSSQQGTYAAVHFVHPRATTTATVDFMIERRLGRASKPLTVAINLSDQHGRSRSLKFKKLPLV